MPAPQKIVTRLGNLNISAFLLNDVPYDAELVITCKACAPRKTRVKRIAELVSFPRNAENHYLIFQCMACRRQWAVPSYIQLVEKESE
jgi:hypothetical protein